MRGLLRSPALLALLIGVAVCAYSASLRLQADATNRKVVVLVDWESLNALPEADPAARLSEKAEWDGAWDLLGALPGALLCYGEETVGSLLESGVLEPAGLFTGAPAYAVTNEAYADDVAQGAHRHGYWMERSPATDGKLLMRLPDLPEDELTLLPVCWRSDVLGLARSKGVALVLRPGGSPYLGAGGLEDTLSFCSSQPLVLFQGPTVLGYPDRLRDVAAQLKAHMQDFGWIEFDEQDGGAGLAALCTPRVLRVHSIPAEEMANYTVAGAVARLVRAASERGIRCLYVRPFIAPLPGYGEENDGYGERLQAANSAYFSQLSASLSAAGFSISADRAFLPAPPARLRYAREIAAGLATAAALLLLLELWGLALATRWQGLILGLGLLGGFASHFIEPKRAAILLLAGILFPLLGFWTALRTYQRLTHGTAPTALSRLGAAAGALAVASGLSILGGIVIHGAMWDIPSMLHITQYRGVTIALALPVLILAAYAWQAETLADAFDSATGRLTPYWQRFTTLWQSPIRYGDVAFILIAMGVLAVVLLRSGNDSALGASGAETSLRQALEGALAVRPRSKELLGHPALLLFLVALPWRNRLGLLLALGGMLGQVSILNTFCHLHTPLGITIERVLLGLSIGAVSGAALCGIWYWLTHVWTAVLGRAKA